MTSIRTDADCAATTCRDNMISPPLNYANNVSNSEVMKGENFRNATSAIAITSIQTKVDSVADKPTGTSKDNILTASLKDPNNISDSKATKKIIHNSTGVVGHSPITTNQMEANSASNNPTITCRDDPPCAPLKYTFNISNSKATNKMKNSTAVVGQGAIMSNQTDSNSALSNPATTCRGNTLPVPVKDTNNVSNSEKMITITMKNSTTVVDHRAAKSNQTEADSVGNPRRASSHDTLPPPSQNTNNVSNYEATKYKKMKDFKAMFDNGTITSTQIKVNSALNNPTTSNSDDTLPAALKDKNNISNSKTTKVRNIQNSNGVVSHSLITRNQTKAHSALTNPTLCRNDMLPAPLKYTINLSNSKGTKQLKNSTAVLGHSTRMSSQTESDLALKNPNTTCRDDTIPAPQKDTNNISKSEEMNNKNSKSAVGHRPITTEQTKSDSAVENPTTCREDSHIAPLKDANNLSNYEEATKNKKDSKSVIVYKAIAVNRTDADSALNKPATTGTDNTLSPPLNDENNVPNSDMTKRKKVRNSTSVVGCGAITSIQNEVDSVVDDPTGAFTENTNNISNAMEINKKENSKSVVGHIATTSNQTKVDSAVVNPTATCKEESHFASLKDTNKVSNYEETKKNMIKNSRSVVDNSTITSNQTAADSAFNKPAATRMDNTLTPHINVTNNVPNSDMAKVENISSTSAVGHGAITSIQTEVDSAVVNTTTTTDKEASDVAPLKVTNNFSKTKKNIKNSGSVVDNSAITSNQTEADSPLKKPTTTSRDNTLSPSLNYPNNVSNSDMTKGENIRSSTSEVGCGAITSIQTEVNSVVDKPTRADLKTLPASLKDINNVSNSEEMKPKTRKNSKSVVGHSVNKTKVDSAVINTTTYKEAPQVAPLKDTNNISKTKKNTIKYSRSVVDNTAITSKQTEADSPLNNPAITSKDNTLSNLDMTKGENIRSSTSEVGCGTISSIQTEVDSVVDDPTRGGEDKAPPASLKDTKNLSNSEAMKPKTRKNSKSMVGLTATASNLSKVDSAVVNTTTTYKEASHISLLKDTNNISNYEETKKNKMKNARSVVASMTSNRTEADSALKKQATTSRDNTLSPIHDTINVSKSDMTKGEIIKNATSEVGCGAISSIQSDADSVVDDATEAGGDKTPPASLKEPNNVSNSRATKKRKIENSNGMVGHSPVTTNQTEANSASKNPTISCRADTFFARLKDIINISNSKGAKQMNYSTAVVHSAITSIETKVDLVVDKPIGACRDNTLPNDDSQGLNSISHSKAIEKRKMNIKSAVVHGSITSNQTEADFALNDPTTTTCRDDSLPSPLEDRNNVVRLDVGIEINNSTAVVGSGTIRSNKTEADSTTDEPTGVCIDDAPTAPLKHTNNISNSEAMIVRKKENAKANQGSGTSHPAQVGSCLDNPSRDHNDNALAIPLNNTDNKRSKSGTPRVKRKRKREKKHKCSECGKLFLFNAHLVVHFRSHTGERPFPCPECGKSFASKTRVAAHQKFHSNEKPYSCSECGKGFYNNTHLQVHQKIHRNERPYSCADCGKTFIHHSNYTSHQEIHLGVKRYLCSYCGKSFRQSSHLHSHQKQHTGDQQFSCYKCRKKFQTESALISHYKLHRITPFCCPECGKHFINHVSFERHQRLHTGHKLLSCHECGKCFINKTHLSIHERIHSGEKPFACTICDRRFSDKSAFNRHHRTHIPKPPVERPANAKEFDKEKTLHASPDTDANQFPCPECKKCFKTQAKLTNHQKSHSKKNPFSCSECDLRFASEALLSAHQKCHLSKKSFSCLKCDISFKTQLELQTHQESHPEKEFLCADCGRHFANETLLATHQKKHLGNKLFSCTTCNKAFRTQMELDTHQKNHPEMKSFLCADCSQYFSSEAFLAAHQKRQHGEKRLSFSKREGGFTTQQEPESLQKKRSERKSLICGNCGLRFTRKKLFAAHQKQHLREGRFPCLICTKGFKTQLELKAHQKNHCDEKPFLCGDCGRRFASEVILAAHRERHVSKKRYLCLDCGHGFNEKSNFEKHCRIHTGEKPYTCSDCGKTFSVKSNMIRHRKIHTGERPYNCLECGKSFRVKSYFIIHQKIHTGVREYSCSQCPKTFRDKSNYQRHKRSHVGGKQFPCTDCGRSFRSPTQLTIHARTHAPRQKFECVHCGKNFKNNWCLNKHTRTHMKKKP